MELDRIEWLENRVQNRSAEKEIRVSIGKNGGKSVTRIVFYNHSHNKITKRHTVAVGIANKRIYFKESNNKGFALSKYSTNGAVCLNLPGERNDLVGEYNLNFDADGQLWYIGA